ncbi:hypothetical protein AAFF_G00152730 [Aldrovandia affinis]|uniref:Uncharacterized protein n=1 Tax=Aldrovandia affinis TaxID=143900 RepID=A0AAD7RP63_9TELE|nr:hypothetical protein AAFF_G00152730 [Aldrovandia affinis]
MVVCHPGKKFDNLVKDCVLSKPEQATESSPILRPSTSLHAPVVSPSVWIPVVVVVNGSILALFLWFIYKRQTRHNHAAVDAEAEISPEVQLDGRTDPVAVKGEGPPTSCPHVNGGPQGLIKQEVPTWRKDYECDTGGGDSVHMCNHRMDHGIPLPATELGDAALVTTKTVRL